MAVQSSGRTVKPAGDTIRRLRLEKGWDVSEMATRAGCTVKTVESVEASSPCFLFTLTGFSKAFGLPDNSQLLAEPASPPKPAVRQGSRIQLKMRFKFPYTDFDFTDQLVKIIRFLIRLIDPDGDIEVVGVAPGSVIVTLEMEVQDAHKLVSALGVGELDCLDISSITTNFGSGDPVEFAAPPKVESTPAPAGPAPQPGHTGAPESSKPSVFKRLYDWWTADPDQGKSQSPYKDKSYSEGASIFDRFKQRR
jgi:transcriptional regulator with XRE-family HTH domain